MKDGRANKEEPHKENDHGMDATRYGAMYLDNDTQPQVMQNIFYR